MRLSAFVGGAVEAVEPSLPVERGDLGDPSIEGQVAVDLGLDGGKSANAAIIPRKGPAGSGSR